MTELDRVKFGPKTSDRPRGLLAEVHVSAPSRVGQVLDRSREVLGIVLRQSAASWPSVEQWRTLLPKWFVDACAEEITRAEAERRRSLPMPERERLAEHWSVGAWVHWLKPSERQWFWWDVHQTSPNDMMIHVEVNDFPFPAGALKWLLKTAGASSVRVDNA